MVGWLGGGVVNKVIIRLTLQLSWSCDLAWPKKSAYYICLVALLQCIVVVSVLALEYMPSPITMPKRVSNKKYQISKKVFNTTLNKT